MFTSVRKSKTLDLVVMINLRQCIGKVLIKTLKLTHCRLNTDKQADFHFWAQLFVLLPQKLKTVFSN